MSFKTGPAWPVAQGHWQAQKLVRAARPIYHLQETAIWPQTAQRIVSVLDSLEVGVQFTAVDPLAYANTGEATLFCNFVVVISVKPNSLAQRDAADTVAPRRPSGSRSEFRNLYVCQWYTHPCSHSRMLDSPKLR